MTSGSYGTMEDYFAVEKEENDDEWIALVIEPGLVDVETPSAAPAKSSADQDRISPSSLARWHTKVSRRDVDQFVTLVLEDESLNMDYVPDFMERALYRVCVRLFLKVLYQTLGLLNGAELPAGLELQLIRSPTTVSENAQQNYDGGTKDDTTGIDERVLKDCADRLVDENSVLNQRLIPDFVERRIYRNCFKLMARLLDTLANMFCVTVCGHDLKLLFEPSSSTMIAATMARQTTPINHKIIRQIMEEEEEDENVQDDDEETKESRRKSPLMRHLILGVYTVVINVVDECLTNTEFQMLNDRVRVDIVEQSPQRQRQRRQERLTKHQQTKNGGKGGGNKNNRWNPFFRKGHDASTPNHATDSRRQSLGDTKLSDSNNDRAKDRISLLVAFFSLLLGMALGYLLCWFF